jgi:hypothetical protein
MDDEAPRDETNRAGEGPEHIPRTPPARRRRRRWPFVLIAILLVPVLLFAGWTWIALHQTYSEGDRAGFIQKFSHKGWVCKTWEGELAIVNMPGTAQERFLFSVRDDSVAHEITRLMGSRVSIHYEQHPGVPTRCFGETEYYVTGVRAVP